MIIDWIKTRWAEVSTKVGLALGALSAAIPQYVAINPKLSYLGLIVSALLVVWNEKRNA